MYFAIVLASLITIMMWLPALFSATVVRGMKSVLAGDPKLDTRELPAWIRRTLQAHQNAVENLPAFIGVCLAAELTHTNSEIMIQAAMVYCIARVAHYVLYALAVPILRTTAFLIGWLATLYIGFMTLQNII